MENFPHMIRERYTVILILVHMLRPLLKCLENQILLMHHVTINSNQPNLNQLANTLHKSNVFCQKYKYLLFAWIVEDSFLNRYNDQGNKKYHNIFFLLNYILFKKKKMKFAFDNIYQ